jgi:hypothetical protein
MITVATVGQFGCFFDFGGSQSAEELVFAAECPRAETEGRHLESRTA